MFDNLWKCLPILAVLLLATTVHAQRLPSDVINDISIDQKLNAQVPMDLEFRDETGQMRRLDEYIGGKPTILNLVYYECPMLCTQVLNGLAGALQPLAFNVGEEFNIVTVSINPNETPELAAKKKLDYVTRYHRKGAEKGWHFLTGDQEAIDKLASAVGFQYVYDSTSKQYAHASGIMVLTPKGKVAAYQFGIEYSAKDLRLALVDASNEKIGSPVDRLILLCYAYDPLTGSYGLVIRNALQIGGVLTVVLIGGFVAISLLRDRRKKQKHLDSELTALPKEAGN